MNSAFLCVCNIQCTRNTPPPVGHTALRIHTHCKQVSFEPRKLAPNMTLPTATAPATASGTRRQQLSIDICCPYVLWQAANADWRDRQTDTRPLHRHCIAYYEGRVNKASGLWVIFTTRCYDSALLLVSVAKWLAHLTAVWEDSGSNHATDSCVYCDSCCDIQSWARAVHLYCSA